jgi:N-acetylmuramoyl-L-alanine amidase
MRPLLLAALVLAGASAPPAALTVASPRGERRVPVVLERGFPAVAADPLGVVLSMERVASGPGTVSLRVLGRAFDFVLDAAYFRSDGQVYTLAAGPYVARDSLFLPLQWAVEYLPRLLGPRLRYDAARSRLEELSEAAARTAAAAPRPAAPRRRRLVAVDPGHGGVDHGMVGPIGVRSPFLREKAVTLAVSRHLVAELESRGIGAVLTRTADTLIALGDRGRIAGDRGADIFVSVHVNAADRRWQRAAQARGFETYILAEARTEDARRVERMENASVRFETTAQAERGDPLSFILRDLAQNEHLRESGQLAELVHGSLGKVHPGDDRGVKQAGFMVLATSYMPAILVEVGFGSNPDEARFLTSAPGQRRIARAIAEGVERYLTEYERRLAAAP